MPAGKSRPEDADEGFDAQPMGPRAHGVGPKRSSSGAIRSRAVVSREKVLARLGVREIQAALAGQQELAADRGHRVVHVDFDGAGPAPFSTASAAMSPAGPPPIIATDFIRAE